MSTVDIASIEEAMKMANLDTLRGYAQNHYGEVKQYTTTEYIGQTQAAGYQVLREPLWNKGEYDDIAHLHLTLSYHNKHTHIPANIQHTYTHMHTHTTIQAFFCPLLSQPYLQCWDERR
jgi:hypothetical protein